jgi:hypothetical protein
MQEKGLFNSQNACTEYEQRLCGTRTTLVRNTNNACEPYPHYLSQKKKYLFSASENQFAEKKDRFPFYFKCKHFTIALMFSAIQKKTRIFPHSKYIGRKYASLTRLKMQNVKLSITGVRAPISLLYRS